MIIDPNELSRLTQQAIDEGRSEAERIEREQTEDNRIKAKAIIDQIPERARTAAKARQSYAIVMGLREHIDFHRPAGNRDYNTCSEHWLTGPAKLVWDACAKLRPELQPWSDGAGMD